MGVKIYKVKVVSPSELSKAMPTNASADAAAERKNVKENENVFKDEDEIDEEEKEKDEEKEDSYGKSLDELESLEKGRKALGIGTVKDWKGGKYIKTAKGWVPYRNGKAVEKRDGERRGRPSGAKNKPKGDDSSTLKPDVGSKMYDRGLEYTASSDYIPDFKTKQEKVDWEAGLKARYDKQKKMKLVIGSGEKRGRGRPKGSANKKTIDARKQKIIDAYTSSKLFNEPKTRRSLTATDGAEFAESVISQVLKNRGGVKLRLTDHEKMVRDIRKEVRGIGKDSVKKQDEAVGILDEKEKSAIAIGNNKTKLLASFRDSYSSMNDGSIFRNGTLDFENKRLVSSDGKYALQFQTRRYPDRKESYDNQQTSTGYVAVVELTGKDSVKKQDETASKVDMSAYKQNEEIKVSYKARGDTYNHKKGDIITVSGKLIFDTDVNGKRRMFVSTKDHGLAGSFSESDVQTVEKLPAGETDSKDNKSGSQGVKIEPEKDSSGKDTEYYKVTDTESGETKRFYGKVGAEKYVERLKEMKEAGFTDINEYVKYKNEISSKKREEKANADADVAKKKADDFNTSKSDKPVYVDMDAVNALPPRERARVVKTLEGRRMFKGKNMSVREMVESGGFTGIKKHYVPKYEYNRAKYNRLSGDAQREYDKRMTEMKEEYALTVDNQTLAIPKIVFDVLKTHAKK